LGLTFCDAATSADLSLRAQVDSCTPNVECFSNSNYNDSMSAVVAIYAINLSLGAMALCTGGSQPHDAEAADTPCAFTGCGQTRACLNGVLLFLLSACRWMKLTMHDAVLHARV